MTIKTFLNFIKDIFLNIFFSRKYQLVYIIEGSNWSVSWDGRYITDSLGKLQLINGRTSTTHIGLRNKIIHFGSPNTLILKNGLRKVHRSNKVILTWFHISPDDKRIKYIPLLNEMADVVHTSCNITKENLARFGLDAKKIVVVSLGVDLKTFRPLPKDRIEDIKEKFNFPKGKIIIGSFQKDGCGWKDSLKPKLVKGPDIFCDVIEILSKKYPIHVLLTGPSRGYIKNRLENSRISYTHKFIKYYPDIVLYYDVLDIYLITSRAEGGPKAILESMACAVPVVSTPVGMAPEIIIDKKNGLLTKTLEVPEISEKIEFLLNNDDLKSNLIRNGLETVRNYDWEIIAKKYFDKIYNNL